MSADVAELVRTFSWCAPPISRWELTTYSIIVPLALASLLIGILNALGTPWGLLQHYWVLVKLLLTLVATTVLLLETQTISSMAELAESGADPRELPGSLPHSIGGITVLLTITALSIVKPPGLTRYGWRKQQERRRPTAADSR